MKRSHAIALGATGLIVAGVWLGGAGDERIEAGDAADPTATAQIFTSIAECIDGRRPLIPERDANGTAKLTPEQAACEPLFKEAEYTHVAAAPKFASASECEAQYGASQCKPTTFNGASVFVPAMVGFLVASQLSGRGQAQALLPARQLGAAPCPPGFTPDQQPGCLVRREASNASSSSSSSGSSGSGWRSYSTASGHTVNRDGNERTSKVPAGAVATPAPRAALGAAPSYTSLSRSASSWSSSSSSSSVARGGFGSTGHSASSSS